MLTAALRVYRWDKATSSISSDRLEAETVPLLEPALAVYRARLGQPRGQVRNAARLALEGLRPDRVEPLVKVLEDVATYEWPATAGAAERRVAVFEAAALRHPLLEAGGAQALMAARLTPAPADHAEAVATLYADYPEFHRLKAFPGDCTAEALRAAYDLAQAQALLYSATQITVEAGRDFKHVLRYARLAQLLCQVERMRPRPVAGRGRAAREAGVPRRPSSARPTATGSADAQVAPDRSDAERLAWASLDGDGVAPNSLASGEGYRFVLDGPNSVLRRTRAYGVDFARFLAALVRLGDWRLQAEIELRKGWRPLSFTLTAADGLGAHLKAPPEFDSSLEEAIARKFGRERAGWRLSREGAVLEAGASLLVPDFVFRHADGTEVALEIVGYWTPEYLADKLAKLAAVRGVNLIVAVRRHLAVRAGELPATVLPFKRRLLLRDLLPRLEAFRHPAP